MSSVYIAINRLNGKCYVGQTRIGVNNRWTDHWYAARKKKQPRCYFHAALRKYGRNGFDLHTIDDLTDEEANNLEKVWICLLQSDKKHLGYNRTKGGIGGGVFSKEVRERHVRNLKADR